VFGPVWSVDGVGWTRPCNVIQYRAGWRHSTWRRYLEVVATVQVHFQIGGECGQRRRLLAQVPDTLTLHS
jgi:hypothetical protein